MNRKTFSLATILAVFSVAAQAETTAGNGAALYQKLCVSCHALEGRPTIAPPIFGVKNHVIGAHSEREAFVDYVVNWVKAPNADAALMPGAVRKFGVMPTLGYDDAEVRIVAEWLYDSNMRLPDWYKKHYEEEHGEAPKQ